LHGLGTLSGVGVVGLLVDPHAVACKNIPLLAVILGLDFSPGINLLRLHIVERGCEIDVHVSIDDADGGVLIGGFDFQDVDFELVVEDLDGDGVALVQTGEVSQLVLQHCLGVLQVDEFGLVWLQFYHVSLATVLSLQVWHEGHRSWRAWLGEFQHFEHPVGDVAESFLSHEF
jgi:hypothetical protein